MTTHEKALEAAIDACVTDLPDGGAEIDIQRAIAAYLSALLPEDAAGLVDRLENRAVYLSTPMVRHDPERTVSLLGEAASLIQSQAARIAELEAGLEAIAVFPNPPTVSQARARAMLNKDLSHD